MLVHSIIGLNRITLLCCRCVFRQRFSDYGPHSSTTKTIQITPHTPLNLASISRVLDMKRGLVKASFMRWLFVQLIKKWVNPQRSRGEHLDPLHNPQQGQGALATVADEKSALTAQSAPHLSATPLPGYSPLHVFYIFRLCISRWTKIIL